MSKINKSDIFGLFTGSRRVDVMALLVGFKPIKKSPLDPQSRIKSVLWNLLNLFILVAFTYYAGAAIFYAVLSILATWIAYRICVWILRNGAHFRFSQEDAVV